MKLPGRSVRVLAAAPALAALVAASVTAVPAAGSARDERGARAGRAVHAARATAGPTLSATVQQGTWQTNGTVWSVAAAHGVVYVGGSFTSVRPPGKPAGTGEAGHSYLAAFNASSGALLTVFHPTFTGVPACDQIHPCGVTALAVSPDGSRLYVGGSFTGVDGTYHAYIAAVDISAGAAATGATVRTWKPSATAPVHSISPGAGGGAVYLGGDFTKLDGIARQYAGAVDTATGQVVEPWAPVVNGAVNAVAFAENGGAPRVLIGGDFTTVSGVPQQAIDSTNPTTGAPEPWAATIEPYNPPPFTPSCIGQVKDIVTSGTTAYISSEGTGNGCFDGDFAANISDGKLLWQNDCLGATQSVAVVSGWLYKASHAHDCVYSPGGFPQVALKPPQVGWVDHHLLNQSLTDGSLGHWTASTDNTNLGPRVLGTDGTRLFVGGSFLRVNRRPQQGFAIFAPGPDRTTPSRPAQPTVISTSRGVDSVSFPAVSDPDNGKLSYRIYRDGGAKPIATVTWTSWPWALPEVHVRDAGLTPGSTHTYTVSASDGTRTSAKSIPSAPVRVVASSPKLTYVASVLADHPAFLWQLSEKSGTTAADASGHGYTGIYEPGTTQGLRGPIAGTSVTATGFDGIAGLVTARSAATAPAAFSLEFWVKTSTNTGGLLAGFGSAQAGASATYDRRVYMMNDGQLAFGVESGGAVHAIESPQVYNDGRWHYVVGVLSPSTGLSLYVDGQLVAADPTTRTAISYAGFWRAGYDNIAGAWNLDYWHANSQGTTEPYHAHFSGRMADVAVYGSALTAAQIAAHYAANSQQH
jgi:hypothetical protein